MTDRCADLDEFFDGELAADQADAFRDHLATCERCQRVLHGRMQETIAVRGPAKSAGSVGVAPGMTPPAATAATHAAPAVDTAAVIALGHWRGRCVRTLAYLTPVVAAAAAATLWFTRHGESAMQLAVKVEQTSDARGENPHVGDILRSTVRGGDRYRAIWVYLDYHDLVVACPGDPRCREVDGDLTLRLPLAARGEYTVVALTAPDAIAAPPPGRTLDEIRAAPRAGVQLTETKLTVD